MHEWNLSLPTFSAYHTRSSSPHWRPNSLQRKSNQNSWHVGSGGLICVAKTEKKNQWSLKWEIRLRFGLCYAVFHPSIHLSIHPFSTAYLGWGNGGSSLSREAQTSPSPVTSSSTSGGVPRPAERHSPSSVSWVSRGAFYRWDVPWTPHQEGVLTRCPNHLIWVLSAWRSSNFTLSSSIRAALLTRSLKESPATLRWKLISATCTCDLVLSVTTQSSCT